MARSGGSAELPGRLAVGRRLPLFAWLRGLALRPVSTPIALVVWFAKVVCADHKTRTRPPGYILRPRWPRARQAYCPAAQHGPSVSHSTSTTATHNDPTTHHHPPLPSANPRNSSIQTIQGYLQPALNALRHPASLANSLNPNTLLSQVRSASSAQYWSAGIVAAEVIGFFSVGEIIGRFKVVGYREKGHGGDSEAH